MPFTPEELKNVEDATLKWLKRHGGDDFAHSSYRPRKSIIPDTTTTADQPVSGGHSHGHSVDNSDQHNHHDRPSAGKI
jgi:hypothetical protein